MSFLNNFKNFLCIISEFAEFLINGSRENSISSVITRVGWDGKTLEINRRKDPVRASNYSLSLIGHITKAELSLVTKKKDIFNGLLNRFIFIFVERSKIIPVPIDITKIDISNESKELADVFNFCDQFTITNPLVLEFSEEAEKVYSKFYNMQSIEIENPIIDSMTARITTHAIRLSMIFALLDKSKVINEKHILAAIDICEYHIETIEYLFNDIQSHSLSKDDQKIIRLINFLSTSDNNSASRTAISNQVFQNNLNSNAIDIIRDKLVTGNLISYAQVEGKEIWTLI